MAGLVNTALQRDVPLERQEWARELPLQRGRIADVRCALRQGLLCGSSYRSLRALGFRCACEDLWDEGRRADGVDGSCFNRRRNAP